MNEEKLKKDIEIQDILDVLGKTVKKDDKNKLITFLCMLSAFTEDSQFNLMFNAPSSTGKSYIPLEIVQICGKEKKLHREKNPAESIDLKRINGKKKPSFFTDEEFGNIERAAEGNPIYPMVVTARYTGLRLGELLHLEWQDFNWERREVSVKNKPQYCHTVKTYEERTVSVSEQLVYKLVPYIKKTGLCFPASESGRVYNRQGPKKALNRILNSLGIKRVGDLWHVFRRTFASRLVQEGASIERVSKWLGHSGIAVTEKHYADFKPRYHSDIEKLNIIESADKSAVSIESREGVFS